MDTMLNVKELCYSYPDGDSRRIIYDHADVSFEKGKFYALTGDSGSGKTTFLYVIAGLDKSYEGEVSLHDKDINEIGLTKYRRNHVAMIYQNFNLIPYLSPVENIEVALDITDNKVDRSRAAILEILDAVGINGKKARLRASVLSGGEQQRVAIARALATGSKVLIADEPTGNLDVHASDQVISIFRSLAHDNGKCIIMVTHNQRLAAEADEWYEIDQEKKQIVRHE